MLGVLVSLVLFSGLLHFFRTPFLLPLLYPGLIWRLPTTSKIIYLTFDDGPVPGPTEFVLDTLKTFQAKATFFCIGDNVNRHPEVFDRVVAEGHRVGNHTFHHLNGWKEKSEKYVTNVAACQKKLGLAASQFFRPPFGRISRQQIKLLSNYQIVMWDVLTHDYNKAVPPDGCLVGSINATRPGSIVVFHDSLKAERNLMFVLPRFLDHFRTQGYTFASLPA